MLRESGAYEPLFRLESWRVLVEKRADGQVETEATIKIWLPPAAGGEEEQYIRTAMGNGPVNALDKALREAIGEIHPHLRDIDLVNFKVRILDETKGTGAVTRVLIDASDGQRVWGTIGVSENVIAASWDALVDSLEYGMHAPGSAGAQRLSGRAKLGVRRTAAERSCLDAEGSPREQAPGRDHPARAARPGRGRGAGRARGAALRPALARPARGGVRAGVRSARGRTAGVRGVQRHGGPAPRAARRGRAARR